MSTAGSCDEHERVTGDAGCDHPAPDSLWPWAGWHAVVVDGQVTGVHFDAAAAVGAALAVSGSPASVSVFRIGGPDAVAVPPADGGLPAVVLAERRPDHPDRIECDDLLRQNRALLAESRDRLAQTHRRRREWLSAVDQSQAALADSVRLLARSTGGVGLSPPCR